MNHSQIHEKNQNQNFEQIQNQIQLQAQALVHAHTQAQITAGIYKVCYESCDYLVCFCNNFTWP